MRSDHYPLAGLGRAALAEGRALTTTKSGRFRVLLPGLINHPFEMQGVRAGPEVEAVAFPLDWNDDAGKGVAMAIERSGTMVVVTASTDSALAVADEQSLVVDTARRVMGLRTSPPPSTVTKLLDTLWLDRMVETCLASPLGSPPQLPLLLALHPEAENRPVTAEALRHLRRRTRPGWRPFYAWAFQHGVPWAGVGPALASWFDQGSLSRWLFGLLPEAAVMIGELADLVSEPHHRLICEVLEWTESR